MSDENPSRRTLLRGIGAAGASAVGASGIATASDSDGDIGALADQYDDPDVVERQIETHADEVLAELADRGIVAEPSTDVFDLEREIDDVEAGAENEVEGYRVTSYTDLEGTDTADIMVSKATVEHTLTLHVRPESANSYALVVERDSGAEFAIDPSTEEVRIPLDESNSSSGDLLEAGLDALPFGSSTGLAGGAVLGTAAAVAAPSSCDEGWRCSGVICGRTRTNSGGLRIIYYNQYVKCTASFDRCHCYIDRQVCSGNCDCIGSFCG